MAIALMMEGVRISETSVNFNVTTRHYIPEDSKVHTRRRENLKSHKVRFQVLTAVNMNMTAYYDISTRPHGVITKDAVTSR
jgi:hypothetical protein